MALVRKILEATIPSGGSSATFTDSDIPDSLIRVYSTNSNIYPQNISLAGNTLTVTYEAVTSALGVAVELVKQGLEIDDNLTSDASDHALSAKQGKLLKDAIDSIIVPTEYSADDITYDNTISGLTADNVQDAIDENVTSIQTLSNSIDNLDADSIDYNNTVTGMTADNVQDAIDEVFTSVSDGKGLIADAITDKGVPTSADDTFSDMAYNISQISGGGSVPDLKFALRTAGNPAYLQACIPKALIDHYTYCRVLNSNELSTVIPDVWINDPGVMGSYYTTMTNNDGVNSVTFSTTDILTSSLYSIATNNYFFQSATAVQNGLTALYFHN